MHSPNYLRYSMSVFVVFRVTSSRSKSQLKFSSRRVYEFMTCQVAMMARHKCRTLEIATFGFDFALLHTSVRFFCQDPSLKSLCEFLNLAVAGIAALQLILAVTPT